MSTRCVVTFKQKDESTYHVYKHHDGYPETMLPLIAATLGKAWPLPRYENDDFAAAFVATAKQGGGGVRLTTDYKTHGDIEFRYEVDQDKNHHLIVKAYQVGAYTPDGLIIKWKHIRDYDLTPLDSVNA